MKKVILLFIIALTANFNATAQKTKINWMTLEEAVEAQKKQPKKILINTYTNWCGYCKLLDKNTFSNSDVITYINANFYAVKFNTEGNDEITYKGHKFTNPNFDTKKAKGRNSAHQLKAYFNINGTPTIVYIDENNQLIASMPGYKSPKEIELDLKLFATDAFRSIKSREDYENYMANFQYEFKK